METIEPTWQPQEEHGELTTRSNLPDTVYAFPKERKEPLVDASHVRNAVARFEIGRASCRERVCYVV